MKNILDKIQNVYWSCCRMISGFTSPIWYRFFGHKHHIIRTGLTPASWYDVDSRMLYGVMSLVKWFVENDFEPWSDKDLAEELERLDEEETEEYREPYKKAIIAQVEGERQVLEIYKWWKNYENRVKETDDLLTKWYDFVNGETIFQKRKMTKDESSQEKKMFKLLNESEETLQKEEQEYLIKAIKLRYHMWS